MIRYFLETFGSTVAIERDGESISIFYPTKIQQQLQEALSKAQIDVEIDDHAITLDGGEQQGSMRVVHKSVFDRICGLFNLLGGKITETTQKIPSVEIDWSKINKQSISDEELARLDSLSGKRCLCGKETTVAEDEAWGVCYGCYDGNPMNPQRGRNGEGP